MPQATLTLDWLSSPAELADLADRWLAAGLGGAGLLVVLALAAALGLRHATDPDHLVAVGALVAVDGADARAAARLGAWWGIGHASVLLLCGLPLIALDGHVPASIERVAETATGLVIVALAVRMARRWWHRRRAGADVPVGDRRGAVRSARGSAAIGVVHGLGGTGAVAVLLLTALPSHAQAALALSIFAPMTVVSMTACTTMYGHLLAARPVATLHADAGLPILAAVSLVFGAWYAGLV